MNTLPFVWTGPTSLAAELSKPIKKVSVEFAIPNSGPRFVTLWRSDGSGLRIFTEMYDVAERIEVGVLNFDQVFSPRPNEKIVLVSSAFDREIVVSKLIIQELNTRAESGAILAAGNEEIIVVAGVYPYSLAVSGVLSVPHVFEPAYSIEDYTRVPFT